VSPMGTFGAPGSCKQSTSFVRVDLLGTQTPHLSDFRNDAVPLSGCTSPQGQRAKPPRGGRALEQIEAFGNFFNSLTSF